MEIVSKRFSIASKMIFKNLDDQSLIRSKEASKNIAAFLENERFYWISIIKKYCAHGKFNWSKESWKEVVSKSPVGIVKELAGAVQLSFNPLDFQQTYLEPLQIAAKYGSPELCRYIIGVTGNKNPKNIHGYTLLHTLAAIGSSDVCKLIIENVESKNPADISGDTPLHRAAWGGHLAVCGLIIEKIMDKTPADNSGKTPLHHAAFRGYLDISQLIIGNLNNKNPAYKNEELYFTMPLQVVFWISVGLS